MEVRARVKVKVRVRVRAWVSVRVGGRARVTRRGAVVVVDDGVDAAVVGGHRAHVGAG